MFKFFIILLLSISAFTFASDDIDIETDIKIEKTLYENRTAYYYSKGTLLAEVKYKDGNLIEN